MRDRIVYRRNAKILQGIEKSIRETQKFCEGMQSLLGSAMFIGGMQTFCVGTVYWRERKRFARECKVYQGNAEVLRGNEVYWGNAKFIGGMQIFCVGTVYWGNTNVCKGTESLSGECKVL